MKWILCLLTVLMAGTALVSAQAQDIKVYKDSQGWKLQADGKDLPVHGVVWSFTPVGEDYTYNLWKQPKDVVQRTVDTDMRLMKAMGVNAIRIFNDIPPEWVQYIYDTYGIYSMINNLFGRYGVMVNNRYQFPTDYSDPETRKALVAMATDMFNKYKNTRGVLMFMLGNESNYGLEWKTAAVENLPVGERNAAKAVYLYSLFEEALAKGHEIDPHHPMGLINGDVQYLDVLAKEVHSLDVLGLNVYRGKVAGDELYTDVAAKVGKPLVFTEFGCDAYNARTGAEDQVDQALYLKSQWQEVYEQSYGKGKSADCLGGFTFEWMDEWWKAGSDIKVHSTAASWSNGGYAFDHTDDGNNMNEEWFGILAQSELKDKYGLNKRLPRAGFYVLQKVWAIDQIGSSKDQVAGSFAAIDPAALAIGPVEQKAQDPTDRKDLVTIHGSVSTHSYLDVNDKAWTAAGMDAMGWANAASTTFSLDAKPTDNIEIKTTFKAATPYLPYQLDLPGDLARPGPSSVLYTTSTNSLAPADNGYTAELYQATVSYSNSTVDLTAHYHDGHPSWAGEGDYFQMLPESFDYFHEDLAGSKAPFGVEAAFHGDLLEGLKVYGGPEVYFGANPSVLVKYYKTIDNYQFSVIDQEELAKSSTYAALTEGGLDYMAPQINSYQSLGSPVAQNDWLNAEANRRTSLWAQAAFPGITAQAGLLAAKLDRVGNPNYTFVPSPNAAAQQFTIADALAFKADVTTDAVPYAVFHGRFIYAGPLTDMPAAQAAGGSQLTDIGEGNRLEIVLDGTGSYGPFALTEKFLIRAPLYAPADRSATFSSTTAGSPFIVSANRQAIQLETLASYNPGGVYLFGWDANDRMDAPAAAYVSFLYNAYLGATDQEPYLDSYGVNWYNFAALPAVSGTWSLVGHVVGDPGQGFHFTGDVGAAYQQTHNFQTVSVENLGSMVGGKVGWRQLVADAEVYINEFGPQGWMVDQDDVFPLRWQLGLAYSLTNKVSFLDEGNRIGLKFIQWFYNANSNGQYSPNGASSYDYGWTDTNGTYGIPASFTNTETSRFEIELYWNASF